MKMSAKKSAKKTDSVSKAQTAASGQSESVVNEDDVLRRMLKTPPKPHATKKD